MIDSDLLRHVLDGAKLLAMADGDFKERLIAAANEFSAALVPSYEWPGELLECARKLNDELCAGGTYRSTIAAMPESVARGIGERLWNLALAVEVAVSSDMRA
jgi:hypothetical protein